MPSLKWTAFFLAILSHELKETTGQKVGDQVDRIELCTHGLCFQPMGWFPIWMALRNIWVLSPLSLYIAWLTIFCSQKGPRISLSLDKLHGGMNRKTDTWLLCQHGFGWTGRPINGMDRLQSWILSVDPCPEYTLIRFYSHVFCLRTKGCFTLWELRKVVQCNLSPNLPSTNPELNFSAEGKEATHQTSLTYFAFFFFWFSHPNSPRSDFFHFPEPSGDCSLE